MSYSSPTEPGPHGGYPAPPPNDGRSGSDDVGFFAALFDFSFNSFVTPKLVKAFYIFALVVMSGTWLLVTLLAFAQEQTALGLTTLLLGPVVVLFYLILIRMTLEFYIAIVRMSEDINRRLPGA